MRKTKQQIIDKLTAEVDRLEYILRCNRQLHEIEQKKKEERIWQLQREVAEKAAENFGVHTDNTRQVLQLISEVKWLRKLVLEATGRPAPVDVPFIQPSPLKSCDHPEVRRWHISGHPQMQCGCGEIFNYCLVCTYARRCNQRTWPGVDEGDDD